jgi:hypothetical protein
MESVAVKLKRLGVWRLFARPGYFPFFLLFICLLAFSFFIPQLGFYWDDWPLILIAKQGDFSILQDFLLYNRPSSALPYLFTIPILGTDPQNWQLFALSMHFCTAASAWLLIRQVWGHRKLLAEGVALIFLVYPSFTEQSISVTYIPHFFAYTLLFLSLWLSLKAAAEPNRYWLYTLFGLMSSAGNIFMVEYFAGLELLRPIMLFAGFRMQSVPTAQRWRKALLHWIPYLLLLTAFVIWRFFFANIPNDPNQLTLPSAFLASPVNTSITLIQDVIKEFIFILFSVWQAALDPDLIKLTDLSSLFAWGVGIFSALCVGLYLRLVNKSRTSGSKQQLGDWGAQVVGIGALAVFLGMIPVHLIQKDIFTGLFSDRLTLPAVFGAALFWVGLANLALKSRLQQTVLMAILVGLAVGTQIRTSHVYSLDWQKQSRIYWQLHWRAPEIEPNTPLIFSGALSGYVSEYAASAAINTLYESPIMNKQVNYWVFDYFDYFQSSENDFADQLSATASHHNIFFQGSLSDAVFVDYSSDGQCLWVINRHDRNNFDAPAQFRELGSQTDLGSLSRPDGSARLPEADIFGEEPVHTWCYYYEKMEHSRQFADWDRVLDWFKIAQTEGFHPTNQFEMFPALEALQQTAQWEKALVLSREIYGRQRNTQVMLCSIWQENSNGGNLPDSFLVELDEFNQEMGC